MLWRHFPKPLWLFQPVVLSCPTSALLVVLALLHSAEAKTDNLNMEAVDDMALATEPWFPSYVQNLFTRLNNEATVTEEQKKTQKKGRRNRRKGLRYRGRYERFS